MAKHLTKMTASEADRYVMCLAGNGLGLPASQLVSVGHFEKKYTPINHTFVDHAVALVLQGKGFFSWNGSRPQTVEAPFYYYIEPGVPLSYGPLPGTWWEERFVAFGGQRLEEWKALGWFPKAERVYPLLNAVQMAAVHQDILDGVVSRNPDRITEGKLDAERLLFHLYVANIRSEPSHDIEKRFEYLTHSWRRCPQRIPDLKKAASSVGLSYSRFRQLFRKQFHASPYHYLLELRIQEAKRWLRHDDYSVKEIASRTGFDSLESFDRAFRRSTGLSPTQFRRKPEVTGFYLPE